MLARSVMWCACLMACVTSSFMLCISYQWKRACASVLLRRGGINTKTEPNSSPPNNYHLKQSSTHIQSAEKQLTRLSLKRILFITLCHVLSLSFSYSIFAPNLPRILFYPNGFIPSAHTSCLHSAMYLCLCKYLRHCTRHKSHVTLHPSFSVLLSNSDRLIIWS